MCQESSYDGESTNQYLCKQLYSKTHNNLVTVSMSPQDRINRGYSYSQYADMYMFNSTNGSGGGGGNKRSYTVETMEEVDTDGQAGRTDGESYLELYSVAIGRLHLSVVPKTLPGRGKEMSFVLDVLRDIITQEKSSYPLYISGLPGMYMCICMYMGVYMVVYTYLYTHIYIHMEECV